MTTLMKNCILFLAWFSVNSQSYSQRSTSINPNLSKPIVISWVNELQGDFSFTKNWSYPFGIFLNDYGQPVCDGFCLPESEAMKDSTGRIYPDSLEAFYKLNDTTHLYHTLECEGNGYEKGEVNFMSVCIKGKDSFHCSVGILPYHSMYLDIVKDTCKGHIYFNSPAPDGSMRYYISSGKMTINRQLWQKGIMKAEFNLSFVDPDNPEHPFIWTGKVYTQIEKTTIK
ncbi:MAG TPA: hypothetical protein VGF79_04535 [Bacteroidia bacterium]